MSNIDFHNMCTLISLATKVCQLINKALVDGSFEMYVYVMRD